MILPHNAPRALVTALASALIVLSACNSNEAQSVAATETKEKPISLIRIDEPTNGSLINQGDRLPLTLKLVDEAVQPDSLTLYINEQSIGSIEGLNHTIMTEGYKMGTTYIRVTAWKKGQRQTASTSIKIKTNKEPERYTYRIKKTYPHDINAYTQGLFYKNGIMYEGTGQNGKSSIREVELSTGEPTRTANLDAQHFGEGIAMLNGKIYQLTWTSGKCFVYDAQTLKQTGIFTYRSEGWGLTSDGKQLIMSDGSNTLYFMNPENFAEASRIEVYDHKGKVTQLNELEYIDNLIYANVYQTERVVAIDPKTGRVVKEVDFSNLLKPEDMHRNIDVLNGIAWDSTTGRIWVTGKNWPKLFEVELVKR